MRPSLGPANGNGFPSDWGHTIVLPSLTCFRIGYDRIEDSENLLWRMSCLRCPNLRRFEIYMQQSPPMIAHLTPILYLLPVHCTWTLSSAICGGGHPDNYPVSKEDMYNSQEMRRFEAVRKFLGVKCTIDWSKDEVPQRWEA